jgi:hypothetical protein
VVSVLGWLTGKRQGSVMHWNIFWWCGRFTSFIAGATEYLASGLHLLATWGLEEGKGRVLDILGIAIIES